MPAVPVTTLSIRLLGRSLRLFVNGEPFILHAPARSSALLAFLLLHEGAVGRDDAAFALWPDVSEREARANLRRHLHLLQAALPQRDEPWIAADHRSLRWTGGLGSSTDLERGELPTEGAELLSSLDDEWLVPLRERIRVQHIGRLQAAADAAESEGDYGTALRHLRQMLSIDPWSEETVCGLMRVHVHAGDRAAAIVLYRDFARRLHDELGITPSPATTTSYDALVRPETTNAELPVFLTSLHGRELEIEELRDLLSRRRLVTLVGTGGVGKTRLAVETVLSDASAFADDIRFIDLSPLEDDALVAAWIGVALGERESAGDPLANAATRLGTARTLVILDNCEQVVAGAAAAAERLLRAAPRLRLLATSREPLRVPGEVLFEVAPLTFASDAHDALVSPAVQLFLDRAADLARGVDLTSAYERVSRICERLDGLPLAIELAAARIRTMTLGELEGRLGDRLDLLTRGSRTGPERQSTLEATLDWSYQLLSERDRRILRRIAVFRAGFTFAAVEALVDADDRVSLHARLPALVEQSLLVADASSGTMRYRLLQTTRTYLLRKLEDSGELPACVGLHASFFAAVSGKVRATYSLMPDDEWLAAVALDRDNFFAALENTIGRRRDIVSGAAIAAALVDYVVVVGQESLGVRWLERAVALPIDDERVAGLAWCSLAALYRRGYRFDDGIVAARRALSLLECTTESDALARTLTVLGNSLVSAASEDTVAATLAEGRRLVERALSIATGAGLTLRIAEAQFALAVIDHYDGDHGLATEHFQRAADLFGALGKKSRRQDSLVSIAIMSHARGDLATAETLARGCADFASERRWQMMICTAQNVLGLVALERRDLAAANVAFRTAFDAAIAGKHAWQLDGALRNLALLHATRGDDDEFAATLLGYLTRRRALKRLALSPMEARKLDAVRAVLRERLGESRFDDAAGYGANLSRDAIVALINGPTQHIDSRERYGRVMDSPTLAFIDSLSNDPGLVAQFAANPTATANGKGLHNKHAIDAIHSNDVAGVVAAAKAEMGAPPSGALEGAGGGMVGAAGGGVAGGGGGNDDDDDDRGINRGKITTTLASVNAAMPPGE